VSRRLILVLVALAGAVALAVLGALAWLLFSESGVTRVVALVNSLPTVELRVEGARGSLAGGLQLDTLSLGTGRVTLSARAVEFEQAPFGLLIGRLSVAKLTAATVQVRVAPRDPDAPDRAARFMPRWLSASVRDLRVGELDLTAPSGKHFVYRDVSAAGTLTHSRIDLDHAEADAGLWHARGQVALLARDPLRLSGELDWTVRSQPDLRGTLTARGDLDRLEVAAQVTAPGTATVGMTVLDLASEMHWRASIGLDELDLVAWLREPPLGPVAGHFEATGTARDLNASGLLHGPGLPSAGLTLQMSLDFGDSDVQFRSLAIRQPDGPLAIDATGRVVLAEQNRLEAQARWTDFAWPLDGSAVVRSAAGTLEATGWDVFTFTLDADVMAAGAPRFDLTATGQADPAGITFVQAALQGRAGRAEGSGYIGLDASRPWRLEARVRDFDLKSVRADLPSRLSFTVAASGLGFEEDAAWAAYLGPVEGSLRGWPVSGTGYVRHQPGLWEFERFDFVVARAQLEISGHTGRDTTLDARLHAPDLSGLRDDIGGSLEATLKARPAARGQAGASNLLLDVAFKGRDLRLGEDRAAVLSGDARIDLSDQETSWIRLRAAGVTLAGQDLASTRLSLDGYAREHHFELQVGAGERAVDLTGDGAWQDGRYRLMATRISAADPTLRPFELEAPLRLSLSRETARLEQTCFVAAPRRVCVEGSWGNTVGWSATLVTHAFPIEDMSVTLPGRPAYRGRLDLAVEAEGKPGRPWTAHGNATLHDAWLRYRAASGRDEDLSLGVTEIRAESTADAHRFSLAQRDSDVIKLDAQASIQRIDGQSLGESPLAGTITLATTQLGLLPLFVPDIDRAVGRLTVDFSLAGTVAAPLARGRLELIGGALDFYQTNLRMTDVRARADLLDDGLELEATGRIGEGTFSAGGRLAWRERVMRGGLRFTGEQLRVADVPEAHIEASPDLRFAIDGRDIGVSGTVTVPTARIEPRQLLGAVQPSFDEVLTGDNASSEAAPDYRIATDLRLVLGKDVHLNAFGLKGRLEGGVRLLAAPDEVAVASGELEIHDGKYRAYSRELEVERGRLLFAGGPAADPGVDLRAQRTVPGYVVGVIARGRLRKPQLTLYSDPPLPQTQIASLLLVGQTLDSLQSRDRAALGASRPDLVTQGGGILAGQLGRYVGLDEVSVQTSADYDASLVLGKFLSPRLYVSYGISLTQAINTFKLRYTIGDRWVLAGEAGEVASADLLFTVER